MLTRIADWLAGKVKIEDAGFDWKILGPDAKPEDVDYVSYWCDQVRVGWRQTLLMREKIQH